MEGPFKGRSGAVLHVHRSSLFIYQREILENNGVYVVRSRHVKVAGGGGAMKRGGMAQHSGYVDDGLFTTSRCTIAAVYLLYLFNVYFSMDPNLSECPVEQRQPRLCATEMTLGRIRAYSRYRCFLSRSRAVVVQQRPLHSTLQRMAPLNGA